jgi:hypothetical protein
MIRLSKIHLVIPHTTAPFRLLPRQPQEHGDNRLLLREEYDQAHVPHYGENEVIGVAYIRHYSWPRQEVSQH